MAVETQAETVARVAGYLRPFLARLGIPFTVKLRKPRRLPAYHSQQDLDAILQAIDRPQSRRARLKHRDRLIVLTFAFTGLRVSEFSSLRRHARLFGIKPRQLYNVVTRYALAAGIPDLTTHGLCHFFATALVERGTPLKAVQELLGHATIQTTAVYLDLVPGHLRSAVALLSSASVSESVLHHLRDKRSVSGSRSVSRGSRRHNPLLKETVSCGSGSRRATA
ncbi:MAG: tyrosine-type recombinase/integrase [Chloroflexota bacterium]